MKRLSRAGLTALLALAASVPQVLPTEAPAAGQVQPSSSQRDKQQTPAPAPRAQQVPVYLGGGFGYLHSLNPNGCPWPGRRAACARRRAGSTRRMR